MRENTAFMEYLNSKNKMPFKNKANQNQEWRKGTVREPDKALKNNNMIAEI